MILYPSWILARVYDNNTPSNIRNINYIFLALENLVGKNYYPRVKSRRFVTSRICHYIYIIISQLLIKLSIYSLISKLLLPQSELSIIRAFCPQVHLTPGPLNPAVVLWPTNSPSNLNTHTHTHTYYIWHVSYNGDNGLMSSRPHPVMLVMMLQFNNICSSIVKLCSPLPCLH